MRQISQISDDVVADLAGQRAVVVADEDAGNEDHHHLASRLPTSDRSIEHYEYKGGAFARVIGVGNNPINAHRRHFLDRPGWI